MKNIAYRFVVAAFVLLTVTGAHAATAPIYSPYATVQTDVPLNQAMDDSINGVLPYFNSHTTVEGDISTVVDATTPDAPTANVILGPDNTWVGVAWDFGEPAEGFAWKLDRFDAWISAGDNLRKGYHGDLSVSLTGEVDDFAVITNSLHWEVLTQNNQFNHIRYDFPAEFIQGENPGQDRYPVIGFRYLRFNSRGDTINSGGSDVDWQSRFVEIDIWVSQVPVASGPSFTGVSRAESGVVTLNWEAIPGRTYSLEYKSDLSQSGWTFLTSLVADETNESHEDTTAPEDQRFYRLILHP